MFLVAVAGCDSAWYEPHTAPLWQDANDPATTVQHIEAYTFDPAHPQMQIAYSHDCNLFIQLASNGQPVFPFCYNGPATSLPVALHNLSSTQRNAIIGAARSDKSWSPSVQSAKSIPIQKDSDKCGCYLQVNDGCITAACYRIVNGRIEPVKRHHGDQTTQPFTGTPVPPGAFILFAPTTCERPRQNRQRARLEAAAWTPLAMTADVATCACLAVIIPLVLIYVASGMAPRC